MIQSLLLDLDDTLLGNNVPRFMKHYFDLLNAYSRPVFDEETFLPNLMQATRAMIRDTNPELTNAQVFWQAFEQLSGGKQSDMEPFLQRFYETEFDQLRKFTTCRPAAAALVRMALDRGVSVVVATNPLFPRAAIEQRLAWAGIPVTEYDFALVTTNENMHAAKPQPAYYREILAVLNTSPDRSLMVGDDWTNDIAPAAEVGLCAYWIAPDNANPQDPNLIQGCGTLDSLAERIAAGWLEQLVSPATA